MAKIRGFVSGDVLIVEERVLTAGEASAQEFQLTDTPDPDKLILDLPCGTSQIKDSDFEVVGDKIRWNGFSLETLLAAGDNIRVLYSK